jgi:hypothetical protein
VFLVVYLRIYGKCFIDALAAIARSPWTLLLPMGLLVALNFAATLVAPLGIVGGFLLALARTVGFSIYTYFLAEVVARQKSSLKDLKTAMGAYFWTWMNLFFVLWIVDLLLGAALAANPQRETLSLAIKFMQLIVLNAAPEVIYQRRVMGGLDTIVTSFRFLQENWIEWFVPNGLVLAGLWLFFTHGGLLLLASVPFGVVGALLLAGALFHVLMVARGFLFEVLAGSTHRQRMFRFRGKL